MKVAVNSPGVYAARSRSTVLTVYCTAQRTAELDLGRGLGRGAECDSSSDHLLNISLNSLQERYLDAMSEFGFISCINQVTLPYWCSALIIFY